jgi:hypothetical protein
MERGRAAEGPPRGLLSLLVPAAVLRALCFMLVPAAVLRALCFMLNVR